MLVLAKRKLLVDRDRMSDQIDFSLKSLKFDWLKINLKFYRAEKINLKTLESRVDRLPSLWIWPTSFRGKSLAIDGCPPSRSQAGTCSVQCWRSLLGRTFVSRRLESRELICPCPGRCTACSRTKRSRRTGRPVGCSRRQTNLAWWTSWRERAASGRYCSRAGRSLGRCGRWVYWSRKRTDWNSKRNSKRDSDSFWQLCSSETIISPWTRVLAKNRTFENECTTRLRSSELRNV